jgi:perosamine synthetase
MRENRNISVAGTHITDLEEEYVLDALRNGWYGSRKYYYCEKLQEEFAEYHDRKYALMTTNCTSAIHLLLAGLGVGPGDEVIVPECTWIASVSPVTYMGATPVFCDIERDSWCIDPKSLIKSITPNTKAVIAVDLFGNMPDMTSIEKICKDNDIFLIEDAAEALGSVYHKRKAGSFGIGSTFSFHNTKTMSTGEGGMLLIDDDNLYKKCVMLRDHGRGPDTKPYFNDIIGYKFMPFNLQAALGLAQFHRIDELIRIKRDHLKMYRSQLSDLDLEFNIEPDGVINGAWITAMVIGNSYNIDKHKFISKMEKVGIPIRPFFYPLTSIPAFNLEDTHREKNPVSYDISRRGVNLPGAPTLSSDDIKFICDKIREVLK